DFCASVAYQAGMLSFAMICELMQIALSCMTRKCPPELPGLISLHRCVGLRFPPLGEEYSAAVNLL
ncbi:MAG: hypothetical protein ACOYVH_09225, partial [Spirochaetota bacterium]